MADLKKIDFKALTAKLNEFQLDDLNDIDWQNMGSWPLAGKAIFCLLLFVGVLDAHDKAFVAIHLVFILTK